MPRLLTICFLMVALLAQEAEAARRSMRTDSGTVWGAKLECDPAQIEGNQLFWRGYRFSGYAPLEVQNTLCQHAPTLSITSIPGTSGDEYEPVRALFRAGETVSGDRWAFFSVAADACCSAVGDSGFQWMFFHFDDVTIAGLFGPDRVEEDGIGRQIPLDESTTFLRGPDGALLWDAKAYDDEWLCFRTDGSFMGAFAGAELAHCRQGPDSNPATPAALVVPDQDADGREDLALLRDTGTVVLSGADGTELRALPGPDDGSRLVRAISLPDTDDDGVPELGMLVLRLADQRHLVKLVELDASETREVPLPAQFVALDMTSVGDANDDGIVDVGVLARRIDTGRSVVITRNLRASPGCTGACTFATTVAPQARGTEGLRILPVPDANGLITKTYAVLSRRHADGAARVQLTDAAAAVVLRTLGYSAGRTPLDFAVYPDSDNDGEAEVAVLLYRNIQPRTIVRARNVDGDGHVQRRSQSGRTPLALGAVSDTDGDNAPEFLLLGVADRRGSGVAQSIEAFGTPAITATLSLDPAVHVRELLTLPDLDDDGVPEFGVVGTDSSSGQAVIVRGNVSGELKAFVYPASP